MKKIKNCIALVVFLFLVVNLSPVFSQPSVKIIRGNLNTISEFDIVAIKSNSAPGAYDLIALGEIIIDSTTDCRRLNILKGLERLELSIMLETLPKEFKPSLFRSLKYLHINGNRKLQDISALDRFHQLKELRISDYNGKRISEFSLRMNGLESLSIDNPWYLESLAALSKLKNLKELHLGLSGQLKSIDELARLKKLEKFSLEAPKLEKFPKFKQRNHLQMLSLKSNCDITNLQFLHHLISLSITQTGIEIPDFLSKDLEYLYINGRDRTILYKLNNLNQYSKLSNLSLAGVAIRDTISSFKHKSLKKLAISSCTDDSDLRFIGSFDQIEDLNLYALKKVSTFGDCTTKFGTVEILAVNGVSNFSAILNAAISKGIRISYSDIAELPDMEILKKIPSLHIERNKNLLVKDVFISTTWKIENNGEKYNKY